VTPTTTADVDFESEPVLTPAGHRLLDAASTLFYDRGIRAVGVDRIAEEAGTTKKTLYACFGSKDALVALYLRRRAIRWQEFLRDRLDNSGEGNGVERVRQVFAAAEKWHESSDRGCAFVNAYAEVGGANDPALTLIHAEKRWMNELFRRLAREAGVADPDTAGNLLHLIYEGAMVQATAGGEPDAIGRARAAVVDILGH